MPSYFNIHTHLYRILILFLYPNRKILDTHPVKIFSERKDVRIEYFLRHCIECRGEISSRFCPSVRSGENSPHSCKYLSGESKYCFRENYFRDQGFRDVSESDRIKRSSIQRTKRANMILDVRLSVAIRSTNALITQNLGSRSFFIHYFFL